MPSNVGGNARSAIRRRAGDCAAGIFAYEGPTASSEQQTNAETIASSNAQPQIVTACVLIIGNEILSGRTQDENLAFLAHGLNEAGIRLREARVIPDDPERIVTTVNEVRRHFDYVFTTGGIGPTHDDITAQCIADAFGVPLILHPEARRLLETHYPPGGSTRRGCAWRMVPEGAVLLPNPISRAPGFQIGNVFVLPGVPQIMQAIFSELQHRLPGGDKVLSRSVSCGLGEGTLAQGFAALQDRYPDLEIGSYPYFRRGDFGVTLVLRGTDRDRLDGRDRGTQNPDRRARRRPAGGIERRLGAGTLRTWRNGRRSRLKICFPIGSAGSNSRRPHQLNHGFS